MFELPVEESVHDEPWMLSYVERVQLFRRESFRVAYLDSEPNTSSFRYRAFNMASVINRSIPGVSAGWFWLSDRARLAAVMKEADVVVVGRSIYSLELAEAIGIARRFGARVLFDVDDYVFDPSMVPELMRTLDLPTHGTQAAKTTAAWYSYTARIRCAINLADEVLVTNEYLAERAVESLGKPTKVISNFIGADQWAYSQQLVAARGERSADEFHLGYFSGSPSHNRDFAIMAGPLARLLKRHPHTRLRVVGFLDNHQSSFTEVEDQIQLEPLTNYMNLQRLIAQTEVNLAPLQNNRFTNCKSELKYFDAGIVGIPTLASPTFTMSRAIRHGENGFIVADHEWDEYLERIVSEYDAIGPRIGQAALAHCETAYTGQAQLESLVTALQLPV